jgi:hypothetical protein
MCTILSSEIDMDTQGGESAATRVLRAKALFVMCIDDPRTAHFVSM